MEAIMDFECKDVKKEREHKSTDAEKDEGVSSLFWKKIVMKQTQFRPYIQH